MAVNALAVSSRRYGGDATYVRGLIRYLPLIDPADEWTFFILPEVLKSLPPPAPNVRYVECAGSGGSLAARVLWEQVALPRMVHRLQPDVLHAPVNVAPLSQFRRKSVRNE